MREVKDIFAFIWALVKIIVAVVAVFLALVILSSCGSTKKITSESKDSVRVETRWRTEWRTDTLYISIPAQSAERTTASGNSVFENDYAKSEAHINDDGTLFHSLETKPQSRPFPVQTKIEYRDSIIYETQTVLKTTEVEKSLSKWAQFKQDVGGVAIVLIAILLCAGIVFGIWKFRK